MAETYIQTNKCHIISSNSYNESQQHAQLLTFIW